MADVIALTVQDLLNLIFKYIKKEYLFRIRWHLIKILQKYQGWTVYVLGLYNEHMLHHIVEVEHTRGFSNLATAAGISAFPGKWRRKCISVLPGEKWVAVQLEKCYYLPPVFPRETGYLIIVFIHALTLVGRKQWLLHMSPASACCLSPWLKCWVGFHIEFPFDAHHQHDWAPPSSVLSNMFSISPSEREQMIWKIVTESQECGSLLVWGFFCLFVESSEICSHFLRMLIPWGGPGNESLVFIIENLACTREVLN